MDDIVDKVFKYIEFVENDQISVLRNREVIQWVFGDLTFLPAIKHKNKTSDEKEYKKEEDKWGNKMVKIRRPDLYKGLVSSLFDKKQWTNKFGEHIAEELCLLQGHDIYKKLTPIVSQSGWKYKLDVETAQNIIEVKTQTYHTSGTADEKILGVVLKYAEVPRLINKDLKIVCIGGAEKASREKHGVLSGLRCNPEKQLILDCAKTLRMEYIGATDILKALIKV